MSFGPITPVVCGRERIVSMAQPVEYDMQKKWWLLRHHDPKAIDQALMLQNEQRMAAGLEAFVYVIPHQYIKEATHKKDDRAYNEEVDLNNSLRSTLHYYLFIKATEKDIRQLVGGEWNRMARSRLVLCRSKNGAPMWARADEMDRLMNLMIRHREMFNLVTAPLDYKVGDTVMLKTKMFEGYEFNIRKFSVRGEGVNLTLEMPLFNGRFVIRTKSKNVSRERLPVKLQQLLSPDYVRQMEQGLIEILRRRYPRNKRAAGQQLPQNSGGNVTAQQLPVNSKGNIAAQHLHVNSKGNIAAQHLPTPLRGGVGVGYNSDYENLNNFHFISYMKLDDSPEHHHIRALLLLCAALRKDRRAVGQYVPIIEHLLTDKTKATTDEEAFMMAVLYVATHDVAYRDAAKQYQQTHAVASDTLAQLLTIIKYIHFRNDAKKKLSKKIEKKVSSQTRQTLQQIRDCDFSRLSPEALSAISDILSLPPYDTEEGHALQSQLHTYLDSAAQSLPVNKGLRNTAQPLPAPQGEGCPQDGVGSVTKSEPQTSWGSPKSAIGTVGSVTKSEPQTAVAYGQVLSNGVGSVTNIVPDLHSLRKALLHTPCPPAETFSAYYRSLQTHYPDRTITDADDLYTEFVKLLLATYAKVPSETSSWWILKFLLEHYQQHHRPPVTK